MKIRVIWPGKTRKDYFASAIEDYRIRISRMADLEIVEAAEKKFSDNRSAARKRSETAALLGRRSSAPAVYLGATGKMITSEEIAGRLEKHSGGIDFVIGGPEGFDPPAGAEIWSFGRVTLPHELARVVLLEQIFRALTILKKIPYHK